MPGYPKNHPWYIGESSLEVHHVIPCEAVSIVEWKALCDKFDYDINEAHNSVVLPADIHLACELGVQRHRGNHDQGMALVKKEDNTPLQLLQELERNEQHEAITSFPQDLFKASDTYKYPKAAEELIREVLDLVDNAEICSNMSDPDKIKAEFEREMRSKSEKILGYIDDFSWTISWDSRDYRPDSPHGCCNAKNPLAQNEKKQDELRTQKCVARANNPKPNSATYDGWHALGKKLSTNKLELGK